MSATDSPAPILTGKWSDAEKAAFLVSVIRNLGGGTVKWAELAVPRGRSLRACQVMYTELLKAADAVPMTGGPGGPPITPSRQIVKGSKKTAAKEGDDAAVPTKKRTRKPKVSSAAIVNDAEDDDEGDNIAKKAKTEVKTEFKTEEDGGGEYDADAPFDLEEMV